VLIDVDHAGQEFPNILNSIMYNVGFDSVCKYDWRQFAIMLARILDNNMDNYHEVEPSFPPGPFGSTLRFAYDDGESPELDKYVPSSNEVSLDEVLNFRQ